MKYCTKCGAQLTDDAAYCEKCGAAVAGRAVAAALPESGMVIAAKVFMILATVLQALFTWGIALAWCLPMTIAYFRKVKYGWVGTGFKICSLLFVSMIAGILMLCDN